MRKIRRSEAQGRIMCGSGNKNVFDVNSILTMRHGTDIDWRLYVASRIPKSHVT